MKKSDKPTNLTSRSQLPVCIRSIFSLLFSLVLFSSLPGMAKIAYPGIIEAAQPDGSVIKIKLEGNFHNRTAYSEDGYPLVFDEDGFYVFADIDDRGLPFATSIKEINPEDRTVDINSRISLINKDKVLTAISGLKSSAQKIATRGPGLFNTDYPTSGKQKGLVILVEFSDISFSLEEPNDYFHRMLNEEGFSDDGGTGSARDYFISNSKGQFEPEFDVYGPAKLSSQSSFYGGNNLYGMEPNAPLMIRDACQLLDDEIDFSEYDVDGDGFVDMVYVFYAGYGEADGGGSDTIWPHSWYLSEGMGQIPILDNVKINKYACSNELQFTGNTPDGIGSFVHEFSHVLGLPDLYATGGGSAPTPYFWSVLDRGSYNNNSRTPPNYSTFERFALNWMEPVLIDSEGSYELEDLGSSNKAFIFYADKENEYFLFENRQKIGFDEYLPGHGMLVWHVDYHESRWNANAVNISPSHQYVDLIEADNNVNPNFQSGDSFPGIYFVTSLSKTSHPSYKNWSGESPEFNLIDIQENEGIITFNTVNSKEATFVSSLIDKSTGLIIQGRAVSCEEGSAEIYDFIGKKVSIVQSSPVYLAPGVYIVRSESGETRKFIIK